MSGSYIEKEGLEILKETNDTVTGENFNNILNTYHSDMHVTFKDFDTLILKTALLKPKILIDKILRVVNSDIELDISTLDDEKFYDIYIKYDSTLQLEAIECDPVNEPYNTLSPSINYVLLACIYKTPNTIYLDNLDTEDSYTNVKNSNLTNKNNSDPDFYLVETIKIPVFKTSKVSMEVWGFNEINSTIDLQIKQRTLLCTGYADLSGTVSPNDSIGTEAILDQKYVANVNKIEIPKTYYGSEVYQKGLLERHICYYIDGLTDPFVNANFFIKTSITQI